MTKEQQYETYLTYVAMLAADTAISEAFEFLDTLRKTPLCRHEVKQWAGRARKIVKSRNQWLMNCFNREEQMVVADICDAFEETVKPDIIKFRYAVLLAMQKAHTPNAEISARSAAASLLASLATELIKKLQAEVKGTLHRRYDLRWMCPADLFLCINKIGYILAGDEGLHIHEELCDNIRRGLQVIENKLTNQELVVKIVNENTPKKKGG